MIILSVIDIPSVKEIANTKDSIPESLDYLINKGMDEKEISKLLNIPFHLIILMKKRYKIDKKVLFSSLVEHYERIASMSSLKGKRTEIKQYMLKFPISYEKRIRLILGRISDNPYSVGEETILEALRLSKNKTVSEMNKLHSSYGEVGEISVLLSEDKAPTLTLDEVYYTLREIPVLGRNRTISAIASLFQQCNKKEAKYLSRLLRKKLYLRLPTQTVINMVSKLYNINSQLLNNAVLIKGDIQALLLASKGNAYLQTIQLKPMSIIQPMLCYTFDRRKVIFPSRVEVKYDGWRCIINKELDKVLLHSRTGKVLNDDYPTIVKIFESIPATNFILDGEIVGIKDNKILSLYQMVDDSTIEKSIRVFDVLYYEKPLINNTLAYRMETLRNIVPSEYLSTGYTVNDYDELMYYYDKIVAEGNEGIVIKNLDSKYYINKRNPSWLKLKKSRDTLDVVITKAKYGTSSRGGSYSTFRVAVKDKTKRLLYEVGDVSNLDMETMELLSPKINSLIINKDKEGVIVIPSVVIEVSVFEILRSKEYNSGYSLRNPYFIRHRSDKSIDMIDTIDKIRELHQSR